MLLRSSTLHRAIRPPNAKLLLLRPTTYICHRASASSAAQTEPVSGSNPEPTYTAIHIRQCTKTFRGKRWTVLSIPKDGNDVSKWFQNDYEGDQQLTLKQSILLTRDNVLSTFLPRGYPHSVTPEYRGFAYWQMWHNMAGSVTSGNVLQNKNCLGTPWLHKHWLQFLHSKKKNSSIDAIHAICYRTGSWLHSCK